MRGTSSNVSILRVFTVVLLSITVLLCMWLLFRGEYQRYLPKVPTSQDHMVFLSNNMASTNKKLPPSIEGNLVSTSPSESSVSPLSSSSSVSTSPSESSVSPLSSSSSVSNPLSSKVSSLPYYLIIIVVLSTNSKDGRKARDMIRQTWGQDCHNREQPVLMKFSIGTLGLSPSEIKKLADEDKAHGDLLLLGNLHDTYNNLTRKVLYSFFWADKNTNFSYLLKTDDDTYVFVDELYKEVRRYRQDGVNKLYWGHFNWKSKPITNKNSKWAEPNWFLTDTYLPYAFGGGYVISADLIHNIATTADYVELYHNEDVSVGLWLGPFKIQRKEDNRFITGIANGLGSGKKCAPHACILVTALRLPDMTRFHSQLHG